MAIFILGEIFMPHSYENERDDGGLGLAEAPARPELKEPPLFKVVVFNDDYTPMEFVVELLMRHFAMTEAQASQVTVAIHQQGRGVCGVFTKEVAETKSAQVNNDAQAHQHPLKSGIEQA
jgi:ATP-dependent Clp protease adaptor protein ClpS